MKQVKLREKMEALKAYSSGLALWSDTFLGTYERQIKKRTVKIDAAQAEIA